MGNKIPTNLTTQLSKLLKNKKTRVYIDGGNFYYSTSKNGLRIDFEQIYNYFKTNSDFQGINYYTAFRPEDPDQEKFLDLLTKYQYSLITKPIKTQNGNIKGNMDIELAVDALLQADSFDIFVLFSGDGDFAYLVQKLEQMGKMVIVVCVGGFTSFELHTNVAKFFFLDRIQSVWKRPSKGKKSTMEEVVSSLPPMIFTGTEGFFEPVKTQNPEVKAGQEAGNPKGKTIKPVKNSQKLNEIAQKFSQLKKNLLLENNDIKPRLRLSGQRAGRARLEISSGSSRTPLIIPETTSPSFDSNFSSNLDSNLDSKFDMNQKLNRNLNQNSITFADKSLQNPIQSQIQPQQESQIQKTNNSRPLQDLKSKINPVIPIIINQTSNRNNNYQNQTRNLQELREKTKQKSFQKPGQDNPFEQNNTQKLNLDKQKIIVWPQTNINQTEQIKLQTQRKEQKQPENNFSGPAGNFQVYDQKLEQKSNSNLANNLASEQTKPNQVNYNQSIQVNSKNKPGRSNFPPSKNPNKLLLNPAKSLANNNPANKNIENSANTPTISLE